MKRPILLVVTLFSLFVVQESILAQTIPADSSALKNRIGFHFGLEHNLYLDELVTPLIYNGNGVQFDVNYQRKNIKSLFEITIDYAALHEKAKYHPDRILYITPLEFLPEIAINGDTILDAKVSPASLPHVGFYIAYFRKINPTKKHRTSLYLGGSFCSNIRIPESNNVVAFSPVWLNELNLDMKSSYEFNSKLKVSIGAELPVFSLPFRLPYSISPVEPNKGIYKSVFSDIKAATWNKYQSVNALIGIDYLLNKRFVLQLNASGYYLRYSYPKSIHFLQNNFTGGISYSF